MEKFNIIKKNILFEDICSSEKFWICSSQKVKNKKIGICDKNFNILLPIIFDEICINKDKQIEAKTGTKFYLFDIEENFFYKQTLEFHNVYYRNGRSNIINQKSLERIDSNLWLYLEENEKYGVINGFGDIILDFKYDDIVGIIDGQYELIYVIFNGKSALFDKKGNNVIPPQYDLIGIFKEGLSAVNLDNKYGYIDINNNVILPFIYDHATMFIDGKAKVEINNQKFIIDKTGKYC